MTAQDAAILTARRDTYLGGFDRLGELVRGDPGALRARAGEIRTELAAARQVGTDLNQRAEQARPQWRGLAYGRFRNHIRLVGEELDTAAQILDTAAGGLDRSAGALETATGEVSALRDGFRGQADTLIRLAQGVPPPPVGNALPLQEAMDRNAQRTLAEVQAAAGRADQVLAQVGGQASPGVWTRVIGGLQVVGGAAETVAGGLVVFAPEPTMLTKVLGGVMVAHGVDTVGAGWRTLTSGEVSQSYTFQGAQWTAQALGADATTARWIGAGTDLAAGLGPGVGIAMTQRAALTAATAEGQAALHLGYGPINGLSMPGHNMVGITTREGATQFYHLTGMPGEAVAWSGRVTSVPAVERALGGGWTLGPSVTSVPLTAAQADAALTTARTLAPSVNGQIWSVWGPNCTTTAATVIEAAGQRLPYWAITPMTLRAGVEYPYLGTGLVGGYNGVQSGTVDLLGRR